VLASQGGGGAVGRRARVPGCGTGGSGGGWAGSNPLRRSAGVALIRRQNLVLAGKGVVKKMAVSLVLYCESVTKLQPLSAIDCVESIQFVADLGQERVSVSLVKLAERTGAGCGCGSGTELIVCSSAMTENTTSVTTMTESEEITTKRGVP
jgi:hypothetical protein